MTARFVVDLAALEANVAQVRDTVAPAEVMFVVKDDAYGHGIARACTTVYQAGIRWFGAFDVRTATAVRQVVGAHARIFVWIAASPADIEEVVQHDLDLGVGDRALLQDVAGTALRHGRRIRVHLKVDTGLHRNGVRLDEWEEFVTRAVDFHRSGQIEIVGLWSHIAEASDAEDDAAREQFERAGDILSRAGVTSVMRHLAASAASFARPEFRYDMVRVGAFCYGIRSAGGVNERELGLRPAARLEADVLSVAADQVSIDVGSLDGVPSLLSGRVIVGTPGGTRRVIHVGESESMIESWPGADVGETVLIFGPGTHGEGSATDIAEALNTIGEEVVVRVSPRVARLYESGDARG
ncbi:alanine racemase [Microbacterium sp. C7(2022)]|uniref:alanine racemase n=1 Tax=Microbacterium sp. C7(2022) TaxID=2992759 RepID=UPI00237A49DA|nr:alanine racemase [Microbacterium sp. C7(2022)]MDE0545465.1 alanine racemase [Microbacterium sp. C7(2022)]